MRELIGQQDGVKAAFFGFQDRFRAMPGDYAGATISIANVTQNDNGNGRVESSTTPNESILAWEHLSRSGFLNATFSYNAVESPTTSLRNNYGVFLQIAYDGIYGEGSVGTPEMLRHNLKSGCQIPVEVIAEVDRKIDDGAPNGGSFQFSLVSGQCQQHADKWDDRRACLHEFAGHHRHVERDQRQHELRRRQPALNPSARSSLHQINLGLR